MLKNLHDPEDNVSVRIRDAAYPVPFYAGIEYSAPARGTWNIVHTGMLMPQAHQIFVCAEGCLRGVVLTAAEMNAGDRFSTIAICEENIIDGDIEDLMLDGVDDILNRLPYRPRAVQLFNSCMHHFVGADQDMVFRTLGERYPDIDFVDCYMNPIMRKSGLTPDQLMRRQLYAPLRVCPKDPHLIAVIGNNPRMQADNDLIRMAEATGGWRVEDIYDQPDYDAYLHMAEASYYVTWNPAARAAGDALSVRLGGEHLDLKASYDYAEIKGNLDRLHDRCGLGMPDIEAEVDACEALYAEAAVQLKDTPVEIDYTATIRPLSLARALLDHGIHVQTVYLDAVMPQEKQDFELLREAYPELILKATVRPECRVMKRKSPERVLAIGQKAAYFRNTPYFVNEIEDGGAFGYAGIRQMLQLIIEALQEPKDVRRLIQIKGWGCETCL